MSDYKRNPRGARRARKSLSRKALVVLSLMMVLAVAAVGGTIAWLTDTTETVTNTFTTSDIDITLTETGVTSSDGAMVNSYKMVPGYTITKDPTVHVLANSEKCYLFVKVEKSTNFNSFLSYTMADGWTELPEVAGVYYRTVESKTTNQDFAVIKDNTVTVLSTVTKEAMNKLTTDSYPTLKVTAYATQYMKNNTESFTAADAWTNAQPTPVTPGA